MLSVHVFDAVLITLTENLKTKQAGQHQWRGTLLAVNVGYRVVCDIFYQQGSFSLRQDRPIMSR